MERPFDLLGFGLNATDRIIRVERFPAPGDKLPWLAEQRTPGGQVAVACVVARRHGLRVSYCGSVGNDDAAAFQVEEMTREGVDLSRLRRAPNCASQRAWIFVDATGERTILHHRPAALTFPPTMVDEEFASSWLARGRALHVDGHDAAAAARAAALARARGVLVSADLANLYEAQRAETESLLRATDCLIASAGFPAKLFGVALPPGAALERLRSQFGLPFAALTLGAEGVLALDQEGERYCPGFVVDTVDSTGAGDVFHGAFLVGLLRGWPMAERLEYACALAALNCTAQGARGYIAPPAEVAALRAGARRRSVPKRAQKGSGSDSPR